MNFHESLGDPEALKGFDEALSFEGLFNEEKSKIGSNENNMFALKENEAKPFKNKALDFETEFTNEFYEKSENDIFKNMFENKSVNDNKKFFERSLSRESLFLNPSIYESEKGKQEGFSALNEVERQNNFSNSLFFENKADFLKENFADTGFAMKENSLKKSNLGETRLKEIELKESVENQGLLKGFNERKSFSDIFNDKKEFYPNILNEKQGDFFENEKNQDLFFERKNERGNENGGISSNGGKSIVVNMNNTFGDIKETADVDKIILKLREALERELKASAEGVYR